MTQLITRHIFSEVMQRPYRHPGNYLSTRLCLVSDRLLSGIHAIRIENFKFSFLNSNFLILISILWIPACAGMTARCGLQEFGGGC